MIHRHLKNGLEVVIKENHFSPAVAVQCWVEAGSKDETPEERGLAHFLEHMLFKGTEKRAVGEIASTVENCGGDINAYTSFERTVFYLTMAKEHAEIGVELLADALINSAFDPVEFEREKEVILEEIKRGLDSPGQIVGRKVFELAYGDSEVGRPIIGSLEQVSQYKRDDLVAFYKKWYRPDNIRLLIVGDVDEDQAMAWAESYFGGMESADLPERVPVKRVFAGKTRASVVKGDYQQPRLEVVFPAPELIAADAPALDLVSYALGSGEMSRVNRRLRDRDGVLTAAGVSQYSPGFGGVFEVSAVMSLDKIKEAVHGIAREISLLHGSDPVQQEELDRARMNIKAEHIYRDETVEGQARSLGLGLTTPDHLLFDDVYATKLNKIQLTTIATAIETWLKPEHAMLVALVPDDHPLTEDDLISAFRDGWEQGQKAAAVKKATTRQSKQRFEEAQVFDIKPGFRLVFRRNPEGELFSLTAASAGGLRDETEQTAGFYNAMSSLFGTATKHHSYEELVGLVEGNGAILEGFSGKDSYGFSLQCLAESVPLLMPYFADAVMNPVFPKDQWVSLLREIETTLTAQKDSPSSQCIRRFQEELYGEHPYRFPVVGTPESVAGMSPEKLLSLYQSVRDKGPWIVAASGPMPGIEVAEQLAEAFQAFTPSAEPRAFAAARMNERAAQGEHFIEKQREQTHIVHGYPGLTWGDPDRPALDVMANILGGHGGRMFLKLRDQMSLAYTVTPIVTYGCDTGLLGAYIACAPDKADEAAEAVKKEMRAIVTESVTEAEIQRSRNYIIGNHEMGMQRSEAQTSTMALMELYGFGYDDFVTYAENIAKVTAEDVVRVAKRIFGQGEGLTVRVGPRS